MNAKSVIRVLSAVVSMVGLFGLTFMVAFNYELPSLSPDQLKVMCIIGLIHVGCLAYFLWAKTSVRNLLWFFVVEAMALLVFGKWGLISLPIVAAFLTPLLGVHVGFLGVSFLALGIVLLPGFTDLVWMKLILQFGLAIPVVVWLGNVRRIKTLLEVSALFFLSDVLFRFFLVWPETFDWLEALSLASYHLLLVLASIFVLLEVLGNAYERVSLWRLLELLNPMHPLLKRMREEAPGTYYHSLAVGELTLQAAAALRGTDLLLIRVSCMYHDIGKLSSPKHFTENQMTGEDRYEKKNLKRSKSIIIQHVEDGIRLAKKHRLPRVVRDFIPSHHGTGVTAFYLKDDSSKKKKSDYRYPGPKPWTKEQAIMMLADGVEASARAMQDTFTSKDDYAAHVDRMVQARIDGGQLDESPLTFSDLTTIKACFTETLYAMYHKRVKYPVKESLRVNAASC